MPRARTFKLFLIGWLKRLIVFALVVGGIVLGVSIYVGRTEPSWYEPPAVDDEKVAALADRVEYKLLEEAKRIRETDAPWVLRIRDHQINAWLGTRLRAWISHDQGLEWPPLLGTPQLQLREGEFKLALPVGPEGQQRVTVARLIPKIEEGALTLRLEALEIGRFKLPGDPIETLAGLLDQIGAREDKESWRAFLDLLAGRRDIEPVLELDDGRSIEVLAIQCRPGAVELTSRTLSD